MVANFPERDKFLDELTAKGEPGSIRSYIADNFGKYATPGEMTRFLVRYELFKLVADKKGSIVECGVKSGSGLFQWWHLAKMLDPHGIRRVIIGFDTFEGFPSISEKDGEYPKIGQLTDTSIEELACCVQMYRDAKLNPPHGLSAVKGDFMQTGESFIRDNPFFILSLLYLDFDLYEPTKKALELFLPRMPKGSVLAFDEINNHLFPGETLAVMETIGIRNLELKTFSFNPDVCYAVL